MALDLPGFGGSERPADLSFLELPEAVLGLMDGLGMDRAALIGNSMGGAAAAMVMTKEKADELGLTPRARFVSFSLAGTDPISMLTGPIPATSKALAKATLTIDDIDLFEVNEAFAAVVAAWLKETGADWDKVNVNGGAIALGHPLGASGARLMTTLVNELERSGGRYGLQTMCEGGGLANGTIIESMMVSRPKPRSQSEKTTRPLCTAVTSVPVGASR